MTQAISTNKPNFFGIGALAIGIGTTVIAILAAKALQRQPLAPPMTGLGIHNPKNRCYIHSSLQCLFACRPFCQWLEMHSGSPTEKPLLHILSCLLKEHTTPQLRAELVKELMTCLSLPEQEQQDPLEFITIKLFPKIEEELKKNGDLSSIETLQKLFQISFKSISTPGGESRDTNLFLSLSIGDRPTTLQSLYTTFLKPEEIQELDGSTRQKITVLDASCLPALLTIQLQRFSRRGKAMTEIDIPLTLAIDGARYEVQSMVCHLGGTCANGHYAASAKREDAWYWINDDTVTTTKRTPLPIFSESFSLDPLLIPIISETEIQQMKEDFAKNNTFVPYILFYEKV